MRRLTNFRQLFEVLARGRRARRGARSATSRGASAPWSRGWRCPQPEEGNTLRAEGERDAVQIMTMHRAKGLEADVVFVYGGFNLAGRDGVRSFVDDAGQRRRLAGQPRLPAIARSHQARSRQRGPAPLLRRADARAQAPLPALLRRRPRGRPVAVRRPPREDTWRLTGGYRHVNRRVHELVNEPDTRRLRAPHRSRLIANAGDDAGRGARGRRAGRLAARRPPTSRRSNPTRRCRRCAARAPARSRRRTAASSRRTAATGRRPRSSTRSRRRDRRAPTQDGELPGGAATGIFLHALLEVLPLETLRETPALVGLARARRRRAPWPSRCCAGTDAIPRELTPALRLAHAALTAPLPVVGGVLAGLAPRRAPRARWSSCSRSRPRRAAPTRGFVKGFVDVIFEHEGRSYFGDWKTDRLPGWTPPRSTRTSTPTTRCRSGSMRWRWCACSASSDEAGYEARFGGTLYVFVRGLGRRPTPSAAAARRSPRSARGSRSWRRRWRRLGKAAVDDRHDRTRRARVAARVGARLGRPAPTSTRPRATSRIEAGSWPTLEPAERRAFALLVLASLRFARRRGDAPATRDGGRRASRGSASPTTIARAAVRLAAAASRCPPSRRSSGNRATTGRSSSTAAASTTSATCAWSSASPARSAARLSKARTAAPGRARPRRAGKWTRAQAAAIDAARRRPLTVVTGGPGTGKTALIGGIVRAWLAEGIAARAIAIAAPTGKAANRIAELLAP